MSFEENNWRLIKDTKKGKFCFLIGVNNWAIELQKHEFEKLYKLLIKLNNQLMEIKDELMDEEFINLEIVISSDCSFPNTSEPVNEYVTSSKEF